MAAPSMVHCERGPPPSPTLLPGDPKLRLKVRYFLANILPNVVGRMTAKRKVAGSNFVTDNFSNLQPYLLAVVSFVSTWGGILGKE
jgi:hypothetical protein